MAYKHKWRPSEFKMQKNILFFLFLAGFYFVAIDAEGEISQNCLDIEGFEVEHGALYIPGPNLCTQCVCHFTEPKWCRTMFCNGPMCRNYKVGTTCCQFECLDPPTTEAPLIKEHQRAGSDATSPHIRFLLFLLSISTSFLAYTF